jgi:transposase InsO family protein
LRFGGTRCCRSMIASMRSRYALQATIPHLTRSSLHRCLKRHGISRLPSTDGDKPRRAQFKRYPIGFFHIDLAELRTEQGKLYLLVAIDRTSKFAFVELHERVTRRVAGDFLRHLIAAVPYRVHTVLTDNGTHFTEPSGNTWTPDEIKDMLARKQLFRAHAFELACAQNDVAHRLTKPRHPWTNGPVERMNRTLKEATVRRFYYATHDQLRTHLADFVAAYTFGRRLKTLKGLTPYAFICKRWTREPERFRLDPLHQMPGLNTYVSQVHTVFTKNGDLLMPCHEFCGLGHSQMWATVRVVPEQDLKPDANGRATCDGR